MSAIAYTPRVKDALNTAVLNNFGAGVLTGSTRISGLLDICGPKDTSVENLVTLVLGKNFRLRKRNPDSDEMVKRGVNIYEQRAKLGQYVDFLSVPRNDALYPGGINKILAAAEALGMSAAEAPTRMIETAVPYSLLTPCHTGQPYFSTAHPIKPGSSTTFANLVALGALDFDSYDEAERQLAQLKDEDGRACNSQVRVLAVGQKYKQIGRDIIYGDQPLDKSGGKNLRSQEGKALIVVPDWDDDFWCVFDTATENDRPYYLARGRALTVKPLYIDPEEPLAIMYNELLWALEGDMAIALGNPRRSLMAVQNTNSGTIDAIVAKYRAKFELNDYDFSLS